MKTTFYTFILLCSLVFSSHAQRILPINSGISEGNSSSVGPFLNPSLGFSSARYQQVYSSTAFGQEPRLIYEITFRSDNQSQSGFFGDSTSFQIDLSITDKAPDSLSPVFADNVGANDTAVFGPRSINLTGGLERPRPPVQPFSINISFDHPFYYDPRGGNLLLDMRNFSLGGDTTLAGPMDAVNTVGDGVSSLFADNVNSTSGTLSTKGLVTEFFDTPVPEPSTLTLVGVGLGVLALARVLAKRSHRIS